MAVGDVGIVFQQAVDYLAKFQTHVLDVNWIQNVWDGDMCELDCLPAEFQDIHHATDWTDVYQHCCSAIREAFGFSPENGDNSRELNDDALFWLAVVQSNISVKGIIILANYFIRRGNNRNSSFGDRQTALNAASVYLILNCLPGSKAYRLFHPVVYESALEVLKKCSDLLIDLSKNGMSINKQTRNRRTKRRLSASNSLAPKKRKGAESRKNARKIHLDDDSEEKGDSNSENETSQSEALLFSVQEVNLLRESSVNFLNDLLLYLGYFPLKAYPHSLEHTIQCICEMLKVIPSASDHSCKSHLDLGYKCIKALCGQTHGCSKTTFSTVMKYFLKCIFCQESRIFVTLTSRLIEELPNADALPGACTLIKQLCIKVPERADARTKVSSVVHTIMNQFPPAVFADMIKWLLMYMHNVKVTYRLFGLEVISLLLGHLPETASVENISQSILKYLSDSCLLEAVIGRCSDSAATVRAKALNILASCIGSNISTVHEVMLSMFTSSNVQNTGHSAPRWSSADKGGETRNHGETNSKNERENILHEDTVNFSSRGCEVEKTPSDPKTLNTPSSPRPLAAVEATNLLRCRALDKKVHVRKSAVQVLQSVMEVNEECLSSENINALQNQCRDPSVLVRKQALQSLTGILLSRPLNSELQLAWLKGVLPAIMDSEPSIQEKCADTIDEVLLKNIVPYTNHNAPWHSMVWKILNLVVNDPSVHRIWRFIQRGLSLLSRSGKLSEKIITTVATHTDTENDCPAWLLLSGLSSCIKMKKADFVFKYWESHADYIHLHTGRMVNCLRVLTSVAGSAPRKTIAEYFKKLAALLENFECPFTMIPVVVSALCHFYENGLHDSSTVGTPVSLYEKLMLKCEEYLCALISTKNKNVSNLDEELIIKYLVTLGEVATICPKQVSRRIFLMMNAFLISPESLKSKDSNSKTQRGTLPVFSERLRHFGLSVLGKLCIQHQSFAKECLPLLNMEVETSDNPSVRHNIIVIMVDLCITYPSLVESYFSSIIACLKDPSVRVKTKTMAFITHLLQEDFIKWRGSLYVCFMASLVDESPQIRTFTKYALLHVLKKHHPTMIFQNFMECLVFFNDFRDHDKYNKVRHSETECKLFSLPGEKNSLKRMTLFKFMLENMTDDQRFHITLKLCQDILDAVVDDHIILQHRNDECSNGISLVKDTLAILCCEEIKLTTLRACPQDDLDDGDVAAALVATAKKTIISQVVKKNTIETIVPIIIALKHKLEKLLSPLLKDIMQYLKEIMKDYKSEIKDILAADKQLAIELEYDMRKFEQQQMEEQQQQQQKQQKSSHLTKEKLNDSQLAVQTLPPNNSHTMSPAVCSSVCERRRSQPAVSENSSPQKMPGQPENVNVANKESPLKSATPLKNDENVSQYIGMNSVNSLNASPNVTLTDANLSKTLRSFRKLCPKGKLKESLIDETMTADVSSDPELQPIVVLRNSDRCQSPVRFSEKDILHSKQFTHLKQDLNSSQSSQVGMKTPSKAKTSQKLSREILRAISTPRGVITNITFAEGAQSGIGSLSPIVDSEMRGETTPKLIVHVASPAARLRHNKKWAVKPPQTKRLSLIVDDL